MLQSVESFEYSDTRDGILRFKIRARRLMEERPGKNYLEGIEAFDFNPDGSVRNEIRSRYAEYDRENRRVDFTENVRLFLGREVELRTETLNYDMNAGIGTTKDPVRFYSENIKGKAHGLRYQMNLKLVELESDVDFLISLEKESPDASAAVEEMNAVSDKAFFYGNGSRILFQGNARLQSDSLLIAGDRIRADIDEVRNEITLLSCIGNASYRSENGEESRSLRGDQMLFNIHPGSRNLDKIHVLGRAEFHSVSSTEERRLRGAEIQMFFDPLQDALERIESRIGVELRMKRVADETIISGERFNAVFYPSGRGLKNIDIQQQAKILMKDTSGTADNEIRAERIDIQFREQSGQVILDKLSASDSAQWTAMPENRSGTADTSSFGKLNAAVIEMFYAKDGRFLDRMVTSGDVVMTEISTVSGDDPGKRRISADHARFQFYPENNEPKDMIADGNVRIVFQGDSATDRPGKPRKFQTASDHMQAAFASRSEGIALVSASQQGNFKYEDESLSATSGKCDYDAQNEKMVMSDSPKIFFEVGYTTGETALFNLRQGVIEIRDKVRSIFSGTNEPGLLGESSAGSRNIILADGMQTWTETSRTRYTGNVQLLSEEQRLQSEELEILDSGARLEATGNIRHRIYRSRSFVAEEGKRGNSRVTISKDDENFSGVPIDIKSSNFKYIKDKKTFTYSGNTSLISSDLRMTSGTLEAVLEDSGKEIEWATAKDDVMFIKGKWECKGDVAYYFRAPERIDVVGEPAECIDPEGVKPAAPRLTYNVADDRILLRDRQD